MNKFEHVTGALLIWVREPLSEQVWTWRPPPLPPPVNRLTDTYTWLKLEYIPVGCMPPAHWQYTVLCDGWGVCPGYPLDADKHLWKHNLRKLRLQAVNITLPTSLAGGNWFAYISNIHNADLLSGSTRRWRILIKVVDRKNMKSERKAQKAQEKSWTVVENFADYKKLAMLSLKACTE